MTRTGTIFVATILILVGSWSGASAQTTGKKAVGKAPADTKAPAETKAPVETKAPAEAKAPAEPKADPDAELAAIRAQSEAFVAAFNGQDAKALAALWTKNGEYLDESGRRLNGREEIEKGYAEFFANNPGVKIQVTLDAVNLLSPTTAVEDGHAVALRTETSPPSLSRYTVIHVKVDGNWLMASVRDTNIETPAPDSSSKDLEWLIGTWVTEDHGVKVESVSIKTKLVAESMATFIQKVQNFDTSAYLLGWGVATFDAQYSLQSLIRTRTTGADGNFNFGRISDPKIDALVDAMKTETDVAKRNAQIREALILTRDEVHSIPLHHQLRPWAMKKGVTTIHRADDRPEARFTSVNPGGS